MPSEAPRDSAPIIAIDVTDTLARGMQTGIQRVVRKISDNVSEYPDLVLVFAYKGRFYRLDGHAMAELLRPQQRGDAGEPSSHHRQRLKNTIRSQLLRFPALYASMQNRTSGKWFAAQMDRWRSGSPVSFKTGDCLVLLDTFWNGCGALEAAKSARASGASVFTLVHDLIPMSHPHQVPKDVAATFPYHMKAALRISKGALATSLTGLTAVNRQLAIWKMSRRVEFFHLGADKPDHVSTRKDEVNTLRFISVGTIEPRKGHSIILEAFTQLWRDGIDVGLTFIGKVGWIDKSTLKQIHYIAKENPGFIIRNDIEDEGLEEYYATSDASIIASSTEGFGLPVIESLSRGLPVVISDIPIFREIAGDYGLYFQAGNADDLALSLRTFISGKRSDKDTSSFRWPTWPDATTDFYKAIQRVNA